MNSTHDRAADPLVEGHFQALVERSLVGTAVIQDERLLYVNPMLCRIFGYRREELVPNGNPLDLIAEPDRMLVAANMRRRLEGSLPAVEFICGGRRKDGRPIDIEIHGTVLDLAGRPALLSHLIDVTQRRETEEALRESERRFRSLIEDSPIAVGVSHQGVTTYANRKYLELFGYDASDDLRGQPITDLWAPEYREEVLKRARLRAMDLPAETEYEGVGMRKNGSRFPLHVAVTRARIDGHDSSIGFLFDLSERERAATALREREMLLREAERLAELGSASWDLQAGRATWSDEMFRIAGRDPADGAPALAELPSLIAPESWGGMKAAIRRSFATGEPYDIEVEILRPDGRRRSGHAHGAAVRDASGRILRINSVLQDVTRHRQTEEALRLSEARFRGAFDAAGHGMAVVGLDGRFIESNPAFSRITGYGASELQARTFQDITYPDDLAADLHLLAKLVAGELPFYEMEKRYIHTSGAIVWVRLNVALLRDAASRPLHFISQVQDVTARVQAEAERKESQDKLRSALVQTVQALGLAVEKRDAYTAGHQHRVAELARAIARRMGLSEERCSGLYMAALIHDIGKIQVPIDILAKPGRLSPLEFELVRSHSRVGYEIVKDIPLPWPVADMILQHHERLDGSGYPQGLTGGAIIEEARILAVADVLEAMCTHRPYRPAPGKAAALAEIRQGRGRLYDPAAVDAAIAVMDTVDLNPG